VSAGAFYGERMQETQTATPMPVSRKLLCVVYALIAVSALVATWSQNIAHFTGGGSFLGFWEDTKVNPASRPITVDILLLAWPWRS
jgi:hypothetical protein